MRCIINLIPAFTQKYVNGNLVGHLKNLQNPKEWGGTLEMLALSLIYKRDFVIFFEVEKDPVNITDQNFQDKITLCLSNGNHYDCVYPRSHLDSYAFCQSLVFELLYESVFKVKGAVKIARGMVATRYSIMASRNESSTNSHKSINENEAKKDEKRTTSTEKPAFSIKVAKSLDPEYYRNVEFDNCKETKKNSKARNSANGKLATEIEFLPGDKCEISYDGETFHGHVQQLSADKGPVTIFIEEIGEKKIVPYNAVKRLARRRNSTSAVCYQKLSGETDHGQNNNNNNNGSRKKQKKKKQEAFHMNFGRNNTERIKSDMKTLEDQSIIPMMVDEMGMCDDSHIREGMENLNFANCRTRCGSEPRSFWVNNWQDNDIHHCTAEESIPQMPPNSELLINYQIPPSADPNGSDLPFNDVATLRYFFNLGVECHRSQSVRSIPQVAQMPPNPYTTILCAPPASHMYISGHEPFDNTGERKEDTNKDVLTDSGCVSDAGSSDSGPSRTNPPTIKISKDIPYRFQRLLYPKMLSVHLEGQQLVRAVPLTKQKKEGKKSNPTLNPNANSFVPSNPNNVTFAAYTESIPTYTILMDGPPPTGARAYNPPPIPTQYPVSQDCQPHIVYAPYRTC
ncbi:DgyrCDS1267 [Dimorphilus gyrociliatus]|uniref:DgyrCDS1267 n=1 Tax=Dimorphilus gyrociliatus TaxID=2664684 RepID=A0A7I8V6R5_9ANNE|nr:DgyrCDS1267 [Dimorphilus gyrociliatus]